MLVRITKFSEDKTKIDWVCGSDSGTDVLVSSLAHGKTPPDFSEDKTTLIVENTINPNSGISCYPMSGGPIAQTLHRNHLLQDTLENVQADATARGIETSGKTQAELIELIIQDECTKKQAPYYPQEA